MTPKDVLALAVVRNPSGKLLALMGLMQRYDLPAVQLLVNDGPKNAVTRKLLELGVHVHNVPGALAECWKAALTWGGTLRLVFGFEVLHWSGTPVQCCSWVEEEDLEKGPRGPVYARLLGRLHSRGATDDPGAPDAEEGLLGASPTPLCSSCRGKTILRAKLRQDPVWVCLRCAKVWVLQKGALVEK
jgi:hypothetical protein